MDGGVEVWEVGCGGGCEELSQDGFGHHDLRELVVRGEELANFLNIKKVNTVELSLFHL